MIGTYFHRESPRVSPKGVCTSWVAKQHCHACLQAFSSVALVVFICLWRFPWFIVFGFLWLRLLYFQLFSSCEHWTFWYICSIYFLHSCPWFQVLLYVVEIPFALLQRSHDFVRFRRVARRGGNVGNAPPQFRTLHQKFLG